MTWDNAHVAYREVCHAEGVEGLSCEGGMEGLSGRGTTRGEEVGRGRKSVEFDKTMLGKFRRFNSITAPIRPATSED